MLTVINEIGGGGGDGAAITGSQLSVTQATTSYKPKGRTTSDDGGVQSGITKEYTANITGQYSGTTAITVNSKTDTKSNNTVSDAVTNLMWSKVASLSVGASSNGRLPWSDNVSVVNATYRWLLSVDGSGQYYLDLAAGGDPGLSQTTDVVEDDTYMTAGTLGSLAASEWSYGDRDTLGYSTFYVRLADDADPDSKAADYVQITNREDIFGYCDAANTASFAGHDDWRLPNLAEALSIFKYEGATAYDSTWFTIAQTVFWTSNGRINTQTTWGVYAGPGSGQLTYSSYATIYQCMLVREIS